MPQGRQCSCQCNLAGTPGVQEGMPLLHQAVVLSQTAWQSRWTARSVWGELQALAVHLSRQLGPKANDASSTQTQPNTMYAMRRKSLRQTKHSVTAA